MREWRNLLEFIVDIAKHLELSFQGQLICGSALYKLVKKLYSLCNRCVALDQFFDCLYNIYELLFAFFCIFGCPLLSSPFDDLLFFASLFTLLLSSWFLRGVNLI
jgi:hypothetical protein